MLLLMVVAMTWNSGFQVSPLYSKEGSGVLMERNLCFDLTKDNTACKLELSKNE